MRRENVENAVREIEKIMSDDNLVKDAFLRTRMDEEGFVPLALVGNYPSVGRYNAYYRDLMNALDNNPMFTVDAPNETFRLAEGWDKWLMPGPKGTMGCPRYIKVQIPPIYPGQGPMPFHPHHQHPPQQHPMARGPPHPMHHQGPPPAHFQGPPPQHMQGYPPMQQHPQQQHPQQQPQDATMVSPQDQQQQPQPQQQPQVVSSPAPQQEQEPTEQEEQQTASEETA
jgi:hypothetical protein